MVAGFYHGAIRTSSNYILDVGSTETKIDLTKLFRPDITKSHWYATGKLMEAKTLIKE